MGARTLVGEGSGTKVGLPAVEAVGLGSADLTLGKAAKFVQIPDEGAETTYFGSLCSFPHSLPGGLCQVGCMILFVSFGTDK